MAGNGTPPGFQKTRRGVLVPTNFGYHAIVDKKKRSAPKSATYSEDKVLDVSQRRSLVATARDQQRNFALAKWAVEKHIDYTARFTFQARNQDEELNKRMEELMTWWSRPENCDIRGMHALEDMIAIGERRCVVDGDVGYIKLSGGQLQAIEADRIRKPSGGLPGKWADADITHGVVLNKNGRPRAFIICNRSTVGGFKLSKIVKAENFLFDGYFLRFDQVRGISPWAPAINTFQDLYEGFDYSLVKAKMAALFGVAIKRTVEEETADFVYKDDGTGEAPDEDTTAYDYELKPGLKLELEPGDDLQMIEYKGPSAEFREFSEVMIRVGLLAMDLPYTFFDTKGSSYSAARQEMLQYEESAKKKRQRKQRLLDKITIWKLSNWIAQGLLELPAGMTVYNLKWEWQPAGIPWIDPLKEVKADIEAVKYGLKSRQQISKERGKDWFDILDQLAQEQAAIESKGVEIGEKKNAIS